MILSVNILCWNTLSTLTDTIIVLKDELVGIPSEIIVVDNGSNDGTDVFMNLQKTLVFDDLKIRYIRNEVNKGISHGKNQGVDASNGKYILLIDGDIVPVPNSIRLLIQHLDNTLECQAIGFLPNKFSKEKNKKPEDNFHERFCHKLDPIEEHKGHCIYFGMYRREVFNHVRFDERYGVGYGWEDLDSYMQMERAGIKQWVAGINHKSGKYHHDINSSIRQMGFDKYMSTSLQRSKIFKEKWQGVSVVG